ncbi:MAG: hypothetical protein ACKPKO_08910 [Candidatus Fonsibacter sp.]
MSGESVMVQCADAYIDVQGRGDVGTYLHGAMLGGIRSAMLDHVSLWYRAYEYELQTLAVESKDITNPCNGIGVYKFYVQVAGLLKVYSD